MTIYLGYIWGTLTAPATLLLLTTCLEILYIFVTNTVSTFSKELVKFGVNNYLRLMRP
jgi:hypothetical protein